MDKPSFEESLRVEAARRPRGGEHPSLADLMAYRAGELAAREEDHVQEHLTQCRDCAQLLLDLMEFEQFPQPPAELAPPDERTDAAWRRLRPQLGGGEVAEPSGVHSGPVEAPLHELRPRPSRVPVWRRPALPWALAAGLALCVAGLGWRTATLSGKVDELAAPRAGFSVMDLYPASERLRSGGPGETPAVGRGAVLILDLPRDAPGFPAYEMEVVPAAGGDPVLEPVRGPAERGSLTLELPVSVAAGSYAVRLHGVEGERRQLLDLYPFVITPG